MMLVLHADAISTLGWLLTGTAMAAIGYTYLGYPALLWMLSKTVRVYDSSPSSELGITMIIAAHNEESGLEAKLASTLELDYPAEKLQIIVASDGSTDGTNQIARAWAGHGVELVDSKQRKGKTEAQNVAVQYARNPILVFSDATTHYDRNALRHLAGAYADPRVGAVSGRYDYFDPTKASPAGSGSARLWGMENRIKRMQSRVGTLTGCSGCIYSVRRELYTRLAPETISDLVQPLHVLLQGYRVRFQENAQAWEETTRSTREEFRMRVRVATRGMRGLLSVPELLMPWRHPWIAFQLWSHKILRWCIPIFLIALFAGTALLSNAPVFRAGFLLQALFYAWAAAALVLAPLQRSRLLSLPLYFCTINTAFLVGIINTIRGREFNIWQPVRS